MSDSKEDDVKLLQEKTGWSKAQATAFLQSKVMMKIVQVSPSVLAEMLPKLLEFALPLGDPVEIRFYVPREDANRFDGTVAEVAEKMGREVHHAGAVDKEGFSPTQRGSKEDPFVN